MTTRVKQRDINHRLKKVLIFLSLAPWTTTVFACEIADVGGMAGIEIDFDSFGMTPTLYPLLLSVNTTGDCESISLKIGENQNDAIFLPTFSIFTDNLELFNLQSPSGHLNPYTSVSSTSPLNIPLSVVIEPDQSVPAGEPEKKLDIEIMATSESGETTTFGTTLDLRFIIDPQLTGGFAGTVANQFTQTIHLDLGVLETAKVSNPVNFTIKSNSEYDITLYSEHEGKLVLLAAPQEGRPSIEYALKVDNQTYGLSNGPEILSNLPRSRDGIGTQHQLALWPTGDTNTVRAGSYVDTLTIEVQQRN